MEAISLKEERAEKQLLLIDETGWNAELLKKVFEGRYKLLETSCVEEAEALLGEQEERIAAVLFCAIVPRKAARKQLNRLKGKKWASNVPLFLLLGDNCREFQRTGMQFGAEEIVLRPFEPYALQERILRAAERAEKLQESRRQAEEFQRELGTWGQKLAGLMGRMAQYRDLESADHMRRIGTLTGQLLAALTDAWPEYALTPEQIRQMAKAAELHDIGKIAIPDAILKKPGRLTAEEFEIMKTHTVKGERLIREAGFPESAYVSYARDIALCHHERWDGSGYPQGRRGAEIPVWAHAAALADCYDALTGKRIYKDAIEAQRAGKMILEGACGAFDERLLDCFVRLQPWNETAK